LFKPLSDKDSNRKQPGRFLISGKELHGEITLDGPKTSLYLHDKEHFNVNVLPEEAITGVLHDLSSVSLLDCMLPGGTGHVRRGEDRYFFAEVFPHYIVHGDRHLKPTEKIVSEISLVMDDASTLFYDFAAFGHVSNARPHIEQLIHADGLADRVKPGPYPQILYFTGQHEIFSVATEIGRIFGSHNLKMKPWGPDGVSLLNAIAVTIAFKEGVWFRDAMHHAYTLLSYLGLLVGRPQNIVSLRIRVRDDSDIPVYLDVIQSMPFHRNDDLGHNEKPHPGDILIDAIKRPEEFSQVTANWIARNNEWNDARQRFFTFFREQRHYSIDRLIGSANMFDILPKAAVPATVELSHDLEAARDTARNSFQPLPKSPERDSILSALGRLGKASLKHRVRYRLKKVTDLLPAAFPEIEMVCDEAVNCRNHYVHGSEAPFEYSNDSSAIYFFTDTLEFVFAASDLIESGWDIKEWVAGYFKHTHPFGQYRQGYVHHLSELKFHLGK
jgi:ApeA N-terminal domain 1/Apea-like HEPN